LRVGSGGNEVEVARLGRGESGAERAQAGIGDGSGGKAGVEIGVVRGVSGEIAAVDDTLPAAGEDEAIDDGGVGFKGHLPGEAVGKDAGDKGAVGIDGGFALDERGESDGAVEILLEVDEGGGLPEPAHHGRDDLRGCGGVRKTVGVREQVSLQGLGAGVDVGDEGGLAASGVEEVLAGGEVGLLDARGDVVDVGALGNDDGAGEYITMDDAAVDFGYRRGVVEAVFASQELSPQEKTEEIEGEAGTNDAGVFELATDPDGGRARREIDEDLGAGAEGSEDRPGGHPGEAGDSHEEEQQDSRPGATSVFSAFRSAANHQGTVNPSIR